MIRTVDIIRTMSLTCKNYRNNFGNITVKLQRRNITSLIKKSYELYFLCKIWVKNKSWALHICCALCIRFSFRLAEWEIMSHAICNSHDMRAQNDHATDCYFCLTKIVGITRHIKNSVAYPNIPSAIKPAAAWGSFKNLVKNFLGN